LFVIPQRSGGICFSFSLTQIRNGHPEHSEKPEIRPCTASSLTPAVVQVLAVILKRSEGSPRIRAHPCRSNLSINNFLGPLSLLFATFSKYSGGKRSAVGPGT
jgi:hypothetical protein